MSDAYDPFGYPAAAEHEYPEGGLWFSCPICGPERQANGTTGRSIISRHIRAAHAEHRKTPA